MSGVRSGIGYDSHRLEPSTGSPGTPMAMR
jgi:hypothetical protein